MTPLRQGAALALLALSACPAAAPLQCQASLLTDSANCGACGHACATGSRCQGGACVTTCVGLQCGDACVDQRHDPRNCGACGAVCTAPHAEGVCVDGVCRPGSCQPGWLDCDLAAQNGCEVQRDSCAVRVCDVPPRAWQRGDCALFGLSHDGQRVLYGTSAAGVVPEDQDEQFDLFLYDADAGTRWVTRPRDRGRPKGLLAAVTVTADGRAVYLMQSGGLLPGDDAALALYRLDVDRDELERVAVLASPDGGWFWPTWLRASHDGRALTYGPLGDGGVAFRTLDGGMRYLVGEFSSLSGDGQWGGFRNGVAAFTVRLDTGETTDLHALAQFTKGSIAPQFSYDGARFALVHSGSWVRVYGADAGRFEKRGQSPELSADGRVVAVNGAGGGAVFDVDTGEELLLDSPSRQATASEVWLSAGGRVAGVSYSEGGLIELRGVRRIDGGAP